MQRGLLTLPVTRKARRNLSAGVAAGRLVAVAAGPVAVSAVRYPDGGGELTLAYQGSVRREADTRRRSSGPSRRAAVEAGRRAKTVVRRRARFYGLRYMVTLTYPGGGVHGFAESVGHVQRFIHDYGSVLVGDGAYVAVPELHPEGHGYHWHVLVGGRVDVDVLRRAWTKFLMGRGFERPVRQDGSAGWVRVHAKEFSSPRKAAEYAAKYVAKAFEADDQGRPMGAHRYLTSKGARVPVLRVRWQSFGAADEVIPEGAFVYDSRLDEGYEGAVPILYAAW